MGNSQRLAKSRTHAGPSAGAEVARLTEVARLAPSGLGDKVIGYPCAFSFSVLFLFFFYCSCLISLFVFLSYPK